MKAHNLPGNESCYQDLFQIIVMNLHWIKEFFDFYQFYQNYQQKFAIKFDFALLKELKNIKKKKNGISLSISLLLLLLDRDELFPLGFE